jgi:hypothetical protein
MAQEGDPPDRTPPLTPIQPGAQIPPLPPNVALGIAFQSGPVPPQILEKVTPEHIAQVLTLQDNQHKRQHDLAMRQIDSRERDREKQRESMGRRDRNMMCFGISTLVFILVISWICFQFDQADVVKVLVPAILAAGGGFVAGRGYEKSLE